MPYHMPYSLAFSPSYSVVHPLCPPPNFRWALCDLRRVSAPETSVLRCLTAVLGLRWGDSTSSQRREQASLPGHKETQWHATAIAGGGRE